MIKPPKWNNPDAAFVMAELGSLRALVLLLLVISVCSLGLNSVRAYLVTTQIKVLQDENLRLAKERCK